MKKIMMGAVIGCGLLTVNSTVVAAGQQGEASFLNRLVRVLETMIVFTNLHPDNQTDRQSLREILDGLREIDPKITAQIATELDQQKYDRLEKNLKLIFKGFNEETLKSFADRLKLNELEVKLRLGPVNVRRVSTKTMSSAS